MIHLTRVHPYFSLNNKCAYKLYIFDIFKEMICLKTLIYINQFLTRVFSELLNLVLIYFHIGTTLCSYWFRYMELTQVLKIIAIHLL